MDRGKKAERRTRLRTPKQATAWLRQNGLTHAEFAQQYELSPNVVRKVLYGGTKAYRGQSHRAAVLLGMKRDDSATEPREGARA